MYTVHACIPRTCWITGSILLVVMHYSAQHHGTSLWLQAHMHCYALYQL